MCIPEIRLQQNKQHHSFVQVKLRETFVKTPVPSNASMMTKPTRFDFHHEASVLVYNKGRTLSFLSPKAFLHDFHHVWDDLIKVS